MKKLMGTMLLVVVLTGIVFSEVKDDVLLIPRTTDAPVIDGIMEDVWRNIQAVQVMKSDLISGVDVEDWFDCYGDLRMMYDDTNLYIWLNVHDDALVYGDNWEFDGAEIYFDANDSKTEGAYDGEDDIQLRFNVGESAAEEVDAGYGQVEGWGWVMNGEYLVVQTGLGWLLEASLPLDDLQLTVDSEFGFEAQLNDADDATRETMVRWWQDADNANDQWFDASLFGTAKLRIDRVVSNVLDVPEGSSPTIDGEMGAGEWDDAIVFSAVEPDSTLDKYLMDSWLDLWPTIKMKWNEDRMYLFAEVIDDIVYPIPGIGFNGWEYDCIELYFDGNNSKTQGPPPDGVDDVQIRFNVGETLPSDLDFYYAGSDDWGLTPDNFNYVAIETETGWNLEVSLPIPDLQIPKDANFGFDLQVNDADETLRTTEIYRWDPGFNEHKNASLYGTVKLGPSLYITDVEDDASATVIHSFELSQNYPNPFNPVTEIVYSIPEKDHVSIKVMNVLGTEVAELVNEIQQPGQHFVQFDASQLMSGVYFYRIEAGSLISTRKMILMK